MAHRPRLKKYAVLYRNGNGAIFGVDYKKEGWAERLTLTRRNIDAVQIITATRRASLSNGPITLRNRMLDDARRECKRLNDALAEKGKEGEYFLVRLGSKNCPIKTLGIYNENPNFLYYRQK